MASVDIDLNLEVKNATKAIKSFADKTQKQVKAISSNFSLLGTAAVAAVGAFATGKLLSAVGDVTDAAIIQEDAIKKMNTALALSGEFSDEASKDMQEYASALQGVTTAGDEAILEQVALAKSFGATNDQAKEIIAASLDLAAATGQNLESAVRNVSKTLGGYAGELGESIPALKNLTKEQLQAGEGVALLGSRFKGAAESITKTFGGAVTQSQNIVGDFQEELGFLVTKNSLVTQSIGLFSKAMTKVIEVISDNREEIIGFVNKGLKAFIGTIPTMLKGVKSILKAFEGIALTSSTVKLAIAELILGILEFSAAETAINIITDVFRVLGSTVLKVVESIIGGLQEIPFASDAFKAMGIDIDGVKDRLNVMGDSLTESIGKNKTDELKEGIRSFRDEALDSGFEIQESFAKVNEGMDFVIDTSQELVDDILKIGDAQETSSDKAIKSLNKQAKAQQDVLPGAEKGPQIDPEELKNRQAVLQIESEENKKAIATELKASQDFADTLTFAATAFTTGAKGANSLLKAGAVGAAVAAFGPAGAAAGPIFDLLAQGPEQTKAMIEEFANAIPEIITNLAEAAPVLIEALAENIDKIIVPLTDIELWVGVALAVGKALVTEVPPAVANAMVAVVNQAADQFTGGIASASKDFTEAMNAVSNYFTEKFTAIGDKFDTQVEGVKTAFDQITKPFKDFSDAIAKLVDQVSGGAVKDAGRKATEGFNTVFGTNFAFGGEVPSGFPNDTFPSNLSSGETVIDTSTTDQLKAFLSNGSQGDGAMISMLSQILAALQGEQQISTTVNISEEAIADVILNLTRNNARLAA